MPREVICIHIGQCGIQTGNQIWELFCMEHGIMPDGSNPNDKTPGEENDPYNAYFAELSSGKCVPRAIWLDLDPSTLDDIKKSAYKEMYHPATLIAGKEDAANNGCLGAGRTGRNATREGGGEKGAPATRRRTSATAGESSRPLQMRRVSVEGPRRDSDPRPGSRGRLDARLSRAEPRFRTQLRA